MHLRFVDRGLPFQAAPDSLTEEVYSSNWSLPDGMPLILDERWHPLEPWLTYFRMVSATTSKSTVRNYGYDALRFASFLESRRTGVVDATTEDIVAYRESRLTNGERPVSSATGSPHVVARISVTSSSRTKSWPSPPRRGWP